MGKIKAQIKNIFLKFKKVMQKLGASASYAIRK
jgi:predicted DNA-binding transcriptional regulator AlpA